MANSRALESEQYRKQTHEVRSPRRCPKTKTSKMKTILVKDTAQIQLPVITICHGCVLETTYLLHSDSWVV